MKSQKRPREFYDYYDVKNGAWQPLIPSPNDGSMKKKMKRKNKESESEDKEELKEIKKEPGTDK